MPEWTPSSASRVARSSRRTTRCSTRPRSATSWYVTSRAPATPPRGTPPRPARPASAWRPPDPGATNLVTPIADAYMDSVPLVAITGQVASAAIGTDAFQEADIRGITMPITKHNFLVNDPNDIATTVAEAFYIASTGRPGPVLVDVTKDAMQAQGRLPVADRALAARLPAGDPPAPQAGARGGPADRRRREAGPVRRRRRDPGPGPRRAEGARGAPRHPGGHHADGPRRSARHPRAALRHARYARLGLGGRRTPAV